MSTVDTILAALTPRQRAAMLKRLQAPAPEAQPKAENTFFEKVIAARVPCAYGSAACKGRTFAPHGVGSQQHTSCKPGRDALAAARK